MKVSFSYLIFVLEIVSQNKSLRGKWRIVLLT